MVANGVEYEVDCIIFATGFEVGTEFTRRAGCELYGRDGLTLTEKWADGASTFHGMHTRGFPNLFIFSILQSGFSVNFPHMLDEQARHMAYILKHAADNGVRSHRDVARGRGQVGADDPRPRRSAGWTSSSRARRATTTTKGRPSERSSRDGVYGGGSIAFTRMWDEWRAKGDLEGLELTP